MPGCPVAQLAVLPSLTTQKKRLLLSSTGYEAALRKYASFFVSCKNAHLFLLINTDGLVVNP
jgi:hypothetical protein